MRFATLDWDLPVKYTSGWGSNLVRIPGSTAVLSTMSNGTLYECEALTGDIRVGNPVSGELRDVVFDDVAVGHDAGEADGAWALATFGLCRISLTSLSRTMPNIRKGLGTYQGRMVALSEDVLGISAYFGRSMKLVSRADGAVLKTVTMGAPELVYRLPDGRHRCWSLHHAIVSDLDLESARCVARHAVAPGKGPTLIGDEVFALCGERIVEDGVPSVWDVRPTQLVAFDAYTLQPLRQAAIGPYDVEVLGADAYGRIVVGGQQGLTVRRPDTLAVDGGYDHRKPLGDAVLLGEHNSAVLRNRTVAGSGLTVVTWS